MTNLGMRVALAKIRGVLHTSMDVPPVGLHAHYFATANHIC
jgi:hypothetical protein